ncbi:MAG: DUF493 domain-containing protein [Proteobacteria bacterium]|nr:DUF493 domain-containing protein [Pseudomonadota bacterium]
MGTHQTEKTEGIEYPLSFPIKVIGHSTINFKEDVLEILRKHAPDVDGHEVTTSMSSNKTYISLTCTFLAESREHLETIYAELKASPSVSIVI